MLRADDETVVAHAQFFFYAGYHSGDGLRVITYLFLFEDLWIWHYTDVQFLFRDIYADEIKILHNFVVDKQREKGTRP